MKDEDDFCHGFDCKVKNRCEKYQSGKGLGIYYPKFVDEDGCKFFKDINPLKTSSDDHVWMIPYEEEKKIRKDERNKMTAAITAELKCHTCGGEVIHRMCDNCYENNIGAIKEEVSRIERTRILELFEVCLEQEGFLALDQDDPVVSVLDVERLIKALRSKS